MNQPSAKFAVFTEADAKTKWCPYSRPTFPSVENCGYQPGNRNDDGSIPHQAGCLGSACMAWRWHATHINDKPGDDLYLSPDTYGYCGMAGAP